MATATNVQAWSTTPASNDGADSTIGTVANTSAPNVVDDWVRGIMAAIARYADDTGGALVAGGSATALTVTTGQGLTGSSGQIANGLRLCVRTASAATGAATIAIDSLSAVDIKKNDGSAIVSGDWASGAILDLVYSSTATAFIAANVEPRVDARRASFSAHKNGSNQASVSATTVITFGTESFDVGSCFASNAWTPPAGTVLLTAAVSTSLADRVIAGIMLYKNGSFHKYGDTIHSSTGGTSTITSTGTWVEQTNGTDAWTIVWNGSSTVTVDGTVGLTWFAGTMV